MLPSFSRKRDDAGEFPEHVFIPVRYIVCAVPGVCSQLISEHDLEQNAGAATRYLKKEDEGLGLRGEREKD